MPQGLPVGVAFNLAICVLMPVVDERLIGGHGD
jgi:hypothetical protein